MKNSHLKKSILGFSIIELLLVIAIIAIIGASAIPLSSNFLTRNNLKNKTNELVASLRTAQINSISGKGNSNWGVNTSTTAITLYKGNSYAARDTVFDQVYEIPGSITITNADVNFNKLTGNPNVALSYNVVNNIGDSAIVSVNSIGTVDVSVVQPTAIISPTLTPILSPTVTAIPPTQTTTPTSGPSPTITLTPTPVNCNQYCQWKYVLPGTCIKSQDCSGYDEGRIYECTSPNICCCQ